MRERRIRVTGKPKQQFNIDLLAQAILAIVEQRLAADAPAQNHLDHGDGDAA